MKSALRNNRGRLKQKEPMKIQRIKCFSNSTNTPWSRSEHMKMLHQSGRYAGTSRIGEWNRSEEKRQRMIGIRNANSLNKNSHGYGSEWHMRVANRTLLGNKFQGDEGYIYFLQFPATIKVGFSKDWERRTTKQILGGKVIAIISGPTNDLADLEFDTFIKFQKYTQLDSTGTRYTEFMDKRAKRYVYDYLKQRVKDNPKLKFEIQNNF